MCGIAGSFLFRTEGEKYLNRIEQAIGCMKHRGPDGEGVLKNEFLALGHRRLSIIDTSVAANQPMFSLDKRFVIIFNGEIYNYQEIRKRYLPDHKFSTSSDTEVFLELFIMKGTDCFRYLRGFFAAAICDLEKKELFLVRDRFGKKPVHIYQDENVFLFASELKSLLAFGIPRDVNWSVLLHYFQLNYIPPPLSILRNVKKLLPGHYLKITSSSVLDYNYFELKINKEEYGNISYDGAKKRLVDLMDEATKLRLIADVPLGAFLSGGVDSSVVVALAARHKQQLKTFSIGFKDQPFFDETYYADIVAKKYKTQHTVFSLTNHDFLENIDDILNCIDEPFADSSAIPTFILSKYTRKHVTVALSGDGGDEVFAGYNKYKAEWNAMQATLSTNLIRKLNPLWKVLPKSRNGKITNKVRQLNRFAEAASLPAEERYWHWASIMSENSARSLFSEEIRKQLHEKKELQGLFKWNLTGHDLNEVLLADMQLVLVGDMLVKVDLMGMANSLEIRSPFLDQEVVDFAFGLPACYKIDNKMKKKIVQDSFRDILPEEIYNRPKKGFEIPLLNWFKRELWSLINEDLLEDHFVEEQGIFNINQIKEMKKKLFSKNPGDSHATIWALIVFQHWWKRYIAH